MMAMFETLRAWAGEDDMEERASASEPYGPSSEAHYADPGYQADKRKRYPLDSAEHCRAAWSYINMPKNAAMYSSEDLARIKARIKAAGKKYGIDFAGNTRSDDEHGELRDTELRAYDFEVRSVGDSGRLLEGHVAVFRSVARIPDRNGEFEEEIHPGIFNRYLEKRGFPVMQFDHGKDPRTGTVPIGVYDVFDQDATGYFVRGRLFDNPVVEPVRQAIEGRAIKGMSWRMQVSKNGDRWTRRTGGVDKRDVYDADVPEAGPVVFPAYRDTTVSMRSWLETFEPEHRARLLRELAEEFTDFTGQPARGVGGGDPDTEPRKGDVSTQHIRRGQELDLLLRRPRTFLR